jgi:hypothetical protein
MSLVSTALFASKQVSMRVRLLTSRAEFEGPAGTGTGTYHEAQLPLRLTPSLARRIGVSERSAWCVYVCGVWDVWDGVQGLELSVCPEGLVRSWVRTVSAGDTVPVSARAEGPAASTSPACCDVVGGLVANSGSVTSSIPSEKRHL